VALRFTVLHSSWHADGEEFAAGDHEIAKPSKQLIHLASHAHAAGALDVSEGLDLSTVQSQEDGEKALAEAMGEHTVTLNPDGTRTSRWSGPWQEAQDAQAALEAEQRANGGVTIGIDVEAAEAGETA
jgi:hypothetical protein